MNLLCLRLWIGLCNKLCVSAKYLSMLTSSFVTKELLSAAAACWFFKDSSSSSTWDKQRRIWARCIHLRPPLAVCHAETFWLQRLFETDMLTNINVHHWSKLISHFTILFPPVLFSLSVCNYPSFPCAHILLILWQHLSPSLRSSSCSGFPRWISNYSIPDRWISRVNTYCHGYVDVSSVTGTHEKAAHKTFEDRT